MRCVITVPTLVKTSAAVTATALLGAVATSARTDWHETLDKPRWQPPPPAFGAVWTPLYALIAVAGACLAPYVTWTGFATALNTAIVRRNR